jgi:hypothetical protein
MPDVIILRREQKRHGKVPAVQTGAFVPDVLHRMTNGTRGVIAKQQAAPRERSNVRQDVVRVPKQPGSSLSGTAPKT